MSYASFHVRTLFDGAVFATAGSFAGPAAEYRGFVSLFS